MKTQNTNTVTINSNNASVLEIIGAARKLNPSGSIEIDELESKLNITRAEIIEQCRAIDKGDIVLKVGRKGLSSVILYGAAALDFRARRNSPKTSPQKPPEPKMNAFEFLRLHLANNQTIDFPVESTELVHG